VTQKGTTTRSPRRDWRKPEVTRLNAGMAENFMAITFDGVGLPGTFLS
jgi:hypothetical protein